MNARDAYAAVVCKPRIRLGDKCRTALSYIAAAFLWWFAIDFIPKHWPW